MALLARVQTAPKSGRQVWFEGHRKTRESASDQRVEIEEGSLLDRVKGTRAISPSRLGVFDSVGLRWRRGGDETRDVVYELHEAQLESLVWLRQLMLRVGIELDQNNILAWLIVGRPIVQTTSGDYTYTIPELIRS